MFSENASEHSEYASSIDNRSLLDLEGVKSTERFQRYLGNKPENTSTATSTTDSNQKIRYNVLGEKFGKDAYAYRFKDKTGIILEQNQIDILKGAWRSDTPQKVTCFRDSYRQSFPVDPSCENYFNVPTFDNTVESLLVKRFGPKAAFGRVPCLFSKELMSLEKIAYQGQLAARMGLITSCYTQHALCILLDNLQSDTSNLDGAVQTVRDIFALSTKTFDQMSRTGSFHHMIRRRATMYDTRLSDLKDYATTVMSLLLTSEGIFGSQFDEKLKEKTERNKQPAECLPNLKRVPSSLPMKRKVTSTNETNDSGFKKGKFDNGFKIPKKPAADFKSGATYIAKQNSTNKPWPISSSKGVYKDCNSNSRSFKNSECKASDISTRLVTSKYAEIQSCIRSKENTQSYNKVGVHCQSRKIIIDPSSVNNIHRSTFQFQKGNCVTNSRETDQIKNINSKFNDGAQHSKGLFGSIGFNSIMHRNDPKCSTFYEAYPVTFTTLLETLVKRPTLSNTIYTTPKKSFDMVVRQSQHSQGQITSPVVNQYNNNYRCFQNRFWGSHEGSDFSGQMDRNPTIVTHQYSRVRCSTSHSTTFSTSVTGTKCSDQKRHYDSSSICEQTKGHQINRSILQDLGLVENGNQKQNSFKGSSHSRSKEYFGGSVVTQQNIPNRMDTERSSGSNNFSIWGNPMTDLIASGDNHKAPVFCVWIPHYKALSVDALTISWENMWAYAFPPICLIPKVLKHMSQYKCQIILIAQLWPRRHWYTELLQKSIAKPIHIPLLKNLLHQPKTQIYHPNPEVFKLTAWLLSTEISEIKAFHETLESYSGHPGDLVQNKITQANSKSLIAGVVRGKKDPYTANLADCADFLTSLYTSGQTESLWFKNFVPCFKDNKKLDPNRSIAIYLKRTEKVRKDEGKLFLSLVKPFKPVSSQTIARWIVNTIKMAYGEDDFKVNADSTRAIGPS
ncbi:unnamed protein product [Mytilus coruscus]|uniref:Uncharacterized protein n=1 Tax=Mytilus coruscus TaxID=42192 RepID=A0A6J8ENF8_MYTCO|nr:unnamed protein product [Mytilus coruscus]